MYFSRKCKITFICHGATIYSEEGRFSNVENYPPLSELGVEEMENLTNYIKKRGVKNDVIYTSPSIRTVQSAMMISKLFKKDYVIIDDLQNRNYGNWNGQSISQLLGKYPEQFSDLLVNPNPDIMGDAESCKDFIARVRVILDDLVEQNIGNRIIIVSHPEVIQAAICIALDISPEKMPTIFIRTGSATQISYFENWASLVYSDYVPI